MIKNVTGIIIAISLTINTSATLSATSISVGANSVISGELIDASNGEPLNLGLVSFSPGGLYAYTDEAGKWTISLAKGSYTLTASYVGFKKVSLKIEVPTDSPLIISMEPEGSLLKDVVITATESNTLSSSSLINRDAMDHLQPTSFTDLLELLPGQISKDPQMNKTNSITLRETGALTATGTSSDISDDYAITSLGTAFLVDGATINTDSGMNSVPGASSGSSETKLSSLNRGVDMRTLSTDNIESVEVVRGIPSSEYGNLTSGLVNIKRTKKKTPFTTRFKVDEFSKLISMGKGIGISESGNTLNFDAGYLDSRSDPRDSRETYRRLNGSVRSNLCFDDESNRFDFSIGLDYTGSFDNAKEDYNLSLNKVDEYSNSYNRIALTSNLIFTPRRISFINTFELNFSASYVREMLKRRVQVAPRRASVAPTTFEPGVSEGKYLLEEYIAEYNCDGKPFTTGLKIKENGRFNTGSLSHQHKIGAEWSFSKNWGKGQVYDLNKPLSASWTTRPRQFSDIPAIQLLSVFAEDHISFDLSGFTSELQLGVRSSSMLGLDKRYYLARKIYLDPRVNFSETFPAFRLFNRSVTINAGAGYGLTTRMPTADYLYPQIHYNDFIQLNYYDSYSPTQYSLVSLMTYIDDPTNYKLKAARNRKLEIRLGFKSGDFKGSFTWFNESLKSGFRYTSIYKPYSYLSYDASSIVPGMLTAPPSLDELPYNIMTVLDGYRSPDNGTRIDKQGVEFQVASPRLKAIHTSLIVSGAWFHTRYSNSRQLYQTVTDMVGDKAVSDLYVGLYDTNDGRINDQFNTNFMFDTQIPRWGLIFSSTIQCLWWVKTKRMEENGVPSGYLSAEDGELHPYMPEDANDLIKKFLIKPINQELFRQQTIPPAVYFNFKATKKIGEWLRISAFVNRIIDYLPDYRSNGVLIRRTSSAYFGMEANLLF